MRRKTPQQKKSLSYRKDGRDTYDANDKASRKNLPRKKKRVNRAYRRRANAPVAQVEIAADPDADILIEPWRHEGHPGQPKVKQPDQPLAEHVSQQLDRRARKGMIDEKSHESKELRIRRNFRPRS